MVWSAGSVGEVSMVGRLAASMAGGLQTRLPDALGKVLVLIEALDFGAEKIAARNDAPNAAVVDDGEVAETTVRHEAECVDGASFRTDCDGSGRHGSR